MLQSVLAVEELKLITGGISDVHKVFITPDFTPLEQRQNKALRQQLAAMNKDKKLYVIKNGKIVQRTT